MTSPYTPGPRPGPPPVSTGGYSPMRKLAEDDEWEDDVWPEDEQPAAPKAAEPGPASEAAAGIPLECRPCRETGPDRADSPRRVGTRWK